MFHATQIAACCIHNALAFGGTDTGQRSPVARTTAAADFDKHHGAVGVAHNQVYFATATPGCAVIALQQLQTLVFKKAKASSSASSPLRLLLRLSVVTAGWCSC